MENQQIPSTPSQVSRSSLSSPGDLLNKAWQIYKQRVWVFLGIMIIPWLIIWALTIIAGASTLNSRSQPILLFLLVVLAIVVLAIIVSLWASLALVYAIKDREEKIGIRESFTRGRPKIISYLWISVLVSLVVLAGLIILVIPGIIFAVWFGFAGYVLVCEGLKGTKALSRSKQLVGGYWWPVFGRVLVIVLISAVVNLICSILGLPDILSSLISLFLSPLFIAYSFLIFEDLRKIKGTISV